MKNLIKKLGLVILPSNKISFAENCSFFCEIKKGCSMRTDSVRTLTPNRRAFDCWFLRNLAGSECYFENALREMKFQKLKSFSQPKKILMNSNWLSKRKETIGPRCGVPWTTSTSQELQQLLFVMQIYNCYNNAPIWRTSNNDIYLQN
jgi:hypothetical protein